MADELMISEIDCSTGEQVTRPMTSEEIATYNTTMEDSRLRQIAEEEANTARAENKASALAKLAALGLTEEEAASIAG